MGTASVRIGTYVVTIGTTDLLDPSEPGGRAVEIWHPSGDAPRVLLWESTGERELFDWTDRGAQIGGLRPNGSWWTGLESPTWEAVDLATPSGARKRNGGASSFNTPPIAGRWASRLLTLLPDNWEDDMPTQRDIVGAFDEARDSDLGQPDSP